ncbi:MAG: hypothetical protein KatS3mg102_1819 [Planctomycetota bacterium]|nr:MAG: hypothetical protein KatS3mg102_1819 [Planctomycetota bacterium]
MQVPLGGRVLELACANGALAITAGRLGAAEVTMVDANARAIPLALRGAARSELAGARALLLAEPRPAAIGGPFDLVVAALPAALDPARLTEWVRAAHQVLREGGWLQLAGGPAAELAAVVQARFGQAQVRTVLGEPVVQARRLAQLE